jgi:CRISPR-associated protein Csx3
MAKPIITQSVIGNFNVVKFEIPGGVTSPAEFAKAVKEAGSLAGDKPTLLNGRGPVWGYGMLAHAAHPTPAVATFDPRLGYVVIATHTDGYKEGDTIADPEVA